MIKKIIITSMLVFSLIASSFTYNAFAVSHFSDGDSYGILTTFGILNVDDKMDNTYEVKRSEFVRLAMKIFTDDEINSMAESTDIPYYDVNKNSKDYKYIAAAYAQGYISGDGKNFYPDNKISVDAATKILINIMGCHSIAELEGGYPVGYNKIATVLKIYNGTSFSSSDAIQASEVYKMLMNVLDADYVTFDSQKTYSFDSTRSILSERFKIFYLAGGIVESNKYTSIYQSKSDTTSDAVIINGVKYLTGNTSAQELLGMKVKFYYKSNDFDDPVLVYVKAYGNEVVQIEPDDVDAIGEYSIVYYDAEKKMTANISKTATLVYNGVMEDMGKFLINPDVGSIHLIDNNNDGEYDVIKIDSYKTYIVRSVFQDSMKLSVENVNDGSLDVIDLDQSDRHYETTILSSGKDYPFASIKRESIISYLESSGGTVNIRKVLVSNNCVNGSVSEKGDDYVIVKDTRGVEMKYLISDSADVIASCASSGTFYIDAFGTVVYINITNRLVYGYLKTLYKDNFDLSCRIFTENNRWVNLTFANNIKVNSKVVKRDNLMDEMGNTPELYRQLVSYKVNTDGKVNEINTPNVNSDATYAARKTEREKGLFRQYTSFADTYYYSTVGVIGEKTGIASDTIIFAIPTSADGTFDDTKVYIMKQSQLINSKQYSGISYDEDATGNSKALVLFDPPAMVTNGADTIQRMMIFNKFVSILSETGEEQAGLKGISSGAELVLPIEDGCFSTISSLVHNGDIIQYEYNYNSCVTSVTVMYCTDNGFKQAFTSGSYYSQYSFAAGEVVSIDYANNCMLLRTGVEQYKYYGFNNSLSGVYIYNTVTDRDNKVTSGSISDIQNGDYIYLSNRYCQVRELFIFRN